MRRVKNAVPAAVQVATADVYNRLTDDVMAAEDVVLAHIYPFWENIPPTYALAMLHSRYQALKAHVAPKPVVVAETGWPSGGRPDATPENAATYLVQLASWSRALGVPTFVFSGFDEMWKTNEGAVGPFWGYFTSAGALKPGMERALIGCESSPDVWSGTAVVGGPGTAAIVFTSVPPAAPPRRCKVASITRAPPTTEWPPTSSSTEVGGPSPPPTCRPRPSGPTAPSRSPSPRAAMIPRRPRFALFSSPPRCPRPLRRETRHCPPPSRSIRRRGRLARARPRPLVSGSRMLPP